MTPLEVRVLAVLHQYPSATLKKHGLFYLFVDLQVKAGRLAYDRIFGINTK